MLRVRVLKTQETLALHSSQLATTSLQWHG
jgi:hypothetical protein